MKTLVSVITGRKDFPVFNQMNVSEIIRYLKNHDWSDCEVTTEADEIHVQSEDDGRDTFQIIDVQVVDYRDLD